MWHLLLIPFVVLCGGGAFASPTQNIHNQHGNRNIEQAQESILSSIDNRLNNLQNFLSGEFVPFLEYQLAEQNKKLEEMDEKLTKLESFITNGIGNDGNDSHESVRTEANIEKTYKTILSNTINYLDKKYESNFAKTQHQIVETKASLDKINQELLTQRDSNLEAELSEAIFAIDDLKNVQTSMEENLVNTINHNFNLTWQYERKIHEMLDQIVRDGSADDHKTMEKKVVPLLLISMRKEIKDDLNAYANKVADMNYDVWKIHHNLQETLNSIETKVNETNENIEYGVKSFVQQADGRIHFTINEQEVPDKKVDDYFQKILANQQTFFDSCHRLQMDEAQIENEITDVLKKLITMLDQKDAIEIKDIKNLEKLIKNHDSRIYRNLHQSNTNIVSLFDKTVKNGQMFENNFKDISQILQEVKENTKKNRSVATSTPGDIQRILQSLKSTETKILRATDKMKAEELKTILQQIQENLSSQGEIHDDVKSMYNILKNLSLPKPEIVQHVNANNATSTNTAVVDAEMQKLIREIFVTNFTSNSHDGKTEGKTNSSRENGCKQNYRHLIQMRAGNIDKDCEITLGTDGDENDNDQNDDVPDVPESSTEELEGDLGISPVPQQSIT